MNDNTSESSKTPKDASQLYKQNFAKFHVTQRGKSDRQKAHMVKYEASHAHQKLERWYKRMTTPKPVKSPKPSRKVSVNNSGYSKPTEVKRPALQPSDARMAKRERDRTRIAEFKRRTHWVARSAEEYENMHNY